MQEFLGSIQPLLLALLGMALARYAASTAGVLLEKLINGAARLRQRINETKIGGMMKFDDWLFSRMVEAIAATKGAYVDALKVGSADGKLTKVEMQKANQLALSTFRSSLSGIEMKTVLAMLGEDAWAIIKARIPAIVELTKKENGGKIADPAADPQ